MRKVDADSPKWWNWVVTMVVAAVVGPLLWGLWRVQVADRVERIGANSGVLLVIIIGVVLLVGALVTFWPTDGPRSPGRTKDQQS